MARANVNDEGELEYLAGDRDPYADQGGAASMYRAGQMIDPSGSGLMGHASEVDLSPGKKRVPVLYSGRYVGSYNRLELEADVFAPPGGGSIEVHIHCPKCRNVSRITTERKSIEWDEERKLLSVERFQCTWELPEGRRQEFGIGLCRGTYAIDRNVLKDA